MVKLNRKYHIRRKGVGKGRVRKNPDMKSFGLSTRIENHSTSNVRGRVVQHHKFYKVALMERGHHYYVFTNWGRVGTHGQTKTYGPLSVHLAREMYHNILDKKRSKGYF